MLTEKKLVLKPNFWSLILGFSGKDRSFSRGCIFFTAKGVKHFYVSPLLLPLPSPFLPSPLLSHDWLVINLSKECNPKCIFRPACSAKALADFCLLKYFSTSYKLKRCKPFYYCFLTTENDLHPSYQVKDCIRIYFPYSIVPQAAYDPVSPLKIPTQRVCAHYVQHFEVSQTTTQIRLYYH